MTTYSKFYDPTRVVRKAFTLVELLVAVGIIIVLAAIVTVGVASAKASAKKAATQQFLGSLQTALTQYYADFNMYPPSYVESGGAYQLIAPGRGSAMLAQGLMGFLQNNVSKQSDGAGAGVSASDPHFGFRMHSGGLGKIYGPYASEDPASYRVNLADGSGYAIDAAFIDPYGNEVLYYVATPLTINNVARNTSIAQIFYPNTTYTDSSAAMADAGFKGVFNSADNTVVYNALHKPVSISPDVTASTSKKFWANFNNPGNNNFSSNTSPVTGATGYVLISAGPDGQYFTDDDIVVANR